MSSATTLPSYANNWCLFDAIDSCERSAQPCKCCSVLTAVDENCENWICKNSGRRWVILENIPDMTQPHPEYLCSGSCAFHTLFSPSIARWHRGVIAGRTWDDLLSEEENAEHAKKTEAEKNALKAAKDAKAAAALQDINIGAQINHIHRVQDAQAAKYASRGKIAQPCKKLYSCVGGGAAGGVAHPTTLYVSSECWRYEYTDPQTKKLVRVHTCNWLHPGEDAWQPEWMKDRNFKPTVPIQVIGGEQMHTKRTTKRW
jgi:hypothetical protein